MTVTREPITVDTLRTHSDPLVRVAVERLHAIATTDYRGPRPSEQVEAARALDELVRTADRVAEANRRHDEKVKGAYDEAVEARRGHFSQAWQWGYEYVTQEGTELGKLREEYGLSRDEVEALADGMLPVPQQELLEEYPAIPGVDELELYARIFSRPFPEGSEWVATERKPEPPPEWSPGGLLNYLLDRAGESIMREDAEARAACRAAAKKLYEAVMADEPGDLTAQEERDARRYIEEHRLRHPRDRKQTLNGNPIPPHWEDDDVDHAARTAAFVLEGRAA